MVNRDLKQVSKQNNKSTRASRFLVEFTCISQKDRN